MYKLYVYDPAFILHTPGDGLALLDRETWAEATALYFEEPARRSSNRPARTVACPR